MGKGLKNGVGNKGYLIIGTAIARKVAKAAKRNTKATEAIKRNKCFS